MANVRVNLIESQKDSLAMSRRDKRFDLYVEIAWGKRKRGGEKKFDNPIEPQTRAFLYMQGTVLNVNDSKSV